MDKTCMWLMYHNILLLIKCNPPHEWFWDEVEELYRKLEANDGA